MSFSSCNNDNYILVTNFTTLNLYPGARARILAGGPSQWAKSGPEDVPGTSKTGPEDVHEDVLWTSPGRPKGTFPGRPNLVQDGRPLDQFWTSFGPVQDVQNWSKRDVQWTSFGRLLDQKGRILDCFRTQTSSRPAFGCV